MLITIKTYHHPTIPKDTLYEHIPEDQILTAAQLLVDESFNKDLSFWKHVDSLEDSIKLNLRKLFLGIDFVVTKTLFTLKAICLQDPFLRVPARSLFNPGLGNNIVTI